VVQIALNGGKCNGKLRSGFGWTGGGGLSRLSPTMSKIDQIWRRPGRSMLLGLAVIAGLLSAPAQPTSTIARTNATAPRPPAPRRPSIVLILADDLGYGELGCYGQTRIKTPNLDKLASEGLRFTSFYAGGAICAPSRCALMTGLNTGHAYVRGNGNLPLRPEDLTVAQVLKQAGYRTGLIGKWDLGDENTAGVPHRQGFDDFVGFLNDTEAEDYYTAHLWRYDPRTTTNGEVEIVFPENQGGKKGLYIQDLFTTAALNFLRINKPDQFNRHRPFFLCLAYTIPHANNEEGRRSGDGMQVPGDAPYSNEPWPQAEKNKAAMITRLDGDVGKLMDKLKELKIDEDTIVIFTSDNGPHKEGGVDPKFFQSSGPLRGIKGDLHEGGIRVPLIVRWPAKIKPGLTIDQPWAFWDFLPTAAEIAGAKAPEKTDGISMLPTLLGKGQTNQHAFLYWESHEIGFQQAARMGDWKAVRPRTGEPISLYNLKTDLGEKQNVAAENPKVVAQFEDYLKNARTDSLRWPVPAGKDGTAEKKAE
jgi:arylsulfatase A-like enzyme